MDSFFLPDTPRGPDIVVRRDTFPPDAAHPNPYELVRVNLPRLLWRHAAHLDCGPNHDAGGLDLALLILDQFLPGADVELADGTRCSRAAYHLHVIFALHFIATLPRDGGTIYAQAVRTWIYDALRNYPDAENHALPAAKGEAPAFLPNIYHDLRRLAELTTELLANAGRPVAPGEERPRADFDRVMRTMAELEVHLDLVYRRLGISPKAAGVP